MNEELDRVFPKAESLIQEMKLDCRDRVKFTCKACSQ